MQPKSRASFIHLALLALTALAACAGIGGLAMRSDVLVGGALLLIGTIASLGILWTSTTLRKLVRSLDRSFDRRADRTEAIVKAVLADMREKQSKHEYLQESSLEQLREIIWTVRSDVEGLTWREYGAAGLSFDLPTPSNRQRVLLVTSNGAGLGHLSRCAAVALAGRHLFDSAVLSQASSASLLSDLGIQVAHYPSPAATGCSWPQWHREFGRVLHGTIEQNDFDLVLYDGPWIPRSVTETAGRLGRPLVWLARGTWKETADRRQLRDAGAYCDAIIRPGDVSRDTEPIGKIDRIFQTSPIVLRAGENPLPRGEALSRLGLNPASRHVLIQLGGGVIDDVTTFYDQAIAAVQDLGDEWLAVLVTPDTDLGITNPSCVVAKKIYPLFPILNAFDIGIVAGGYNTVHEVIDARLPSVVIPNLETSADDQLRRALAAESQGLVRSLSDSQSIGPVLKDLADPYVRERMREQMQHLEPFDGAAEAAVIVDSLLRSQSLT